MKLIRETRAQVAEIFGRRQENTPSDDRVLEGLFLRADPDVVPSRPDIDTKLEKVAQEAEKVIKRIEEVWHMKNMQQ